MLYLSWSLSLWILFAASVPLHRLCSHCNCVILPLCIQKVLNWIEYRGSEKIPLLQLFVHVCSLCNLCCLLSTASSLDKAMFSLLRGLLLSSSSFICCSRWILTRRSVVALEEFSPARICIHFLNAELLCLLFWGSCIEGNCLWFTDSTRMKHNSAPWTGNTYLSDLLWSDYTILS